MENAHILIAFAAYILLFIGVSWHLSKKNRTSDDFLLSGRQLSIFLTLGTTVATMVGTGSSMGAVGFGYQNGWAGALYGIGGALGILLLARLFAPVRDHEFSTMSEEIASYVGGNQLVQHIVAVLILAASIGWLGVHIIGGGLYLAWMTGIDPDWAKLVVAAGFAVYVFVGGYSAVVWTDTLQAIILFLGFMATAVFVLLKIGSLSEIVQAQPVQNTGFLSIGTLGVLPALSLVIVVLVGVLAAPSFRQRIYSGRSVQAVKKSFYIAGGLYLAFSFIPALIGMSAYALDPSLEEASFAFPFVAMEVLPPLLGVVVMIAGLSATLSSASSDAIAGVAILVRDILGQNMRRRHEKIQIRASRLGLVAIVIVALLMALTSSNIVDYIARMISTLMSGLCVCALLGRFWPRYTWHGALASLISGSACSIVFLITPEWLALVGNPILPALLAAFVGGGLASVLAGRLKMTAT